MSTLVLEDGSGIANSNTYVEISDVDAYAQELGADPVTANNWISLTDDQKGEAIITAGSYLENMFRWYGLPYFPSRPEGNNPAPKEQAMQWPRTKMYDSHGGVIPARTIPAEVKLAQIFLALQFCEDPSESQVTIENVSPLKDMRIDAISMNFMASSQDSAVTQFSGTRYPYVEFLLKNFGEVRDEQDLLIKKLDNLY